MAIFYDFIYFLSCLAYIPYLCIKGKWRGVFKSRFGFWPRALTESLAGKQNIWIHAVSVGEVLVASQFISRLQKRFPSFSFVLTTVTPTGFDMAQKTFKDDITVLYAPLDFSWVARKFIRIIHPRVYVMTETEIWPNLLTALRQNKTPILLINGRISPRSFQGYKKVGWLIKNILGLINVFCMQSQDDAGKIIALGADEKKVHVVGNVKFDAVGDEEKFSLEELGLKDCRLVWVAGSTHFGEEEMILEVFKELKKEFSGFYLVIVPRHPERTRDIVHLVRRYGFQGIRFSAFQGRQIPADGVMIVDLMGQLKKFYSVASVVFVGKSLVGGGGQNMIEPAFFAKPILIGPMTDNFKDAVRIFLRDKAILQVKDKDDLLVNLRLLLRHPEQSQQLGQLAKKVVSENKGATDRTIELFERIVKNG